MALDLKIPELNGLTVLQQVRQLNPTQSVIIMTGAGTVEAEQQDRVPEVAEFVENELCCTSWGIL